MRATSKLPHFAHAVGGMCLLASACAADPGDPDKTISNGAGSGYSSTAASGSSSASGSNGGAGSASGSSFVSGSVASGSTGSTATSGASTGQSPVGDASVGDATVVVPFSPLEVDYFTIDTMTPATENQIQFRLQVVNRGGASVNLTDVTMRYWFSIDGNSLSGLYFQSYYAQNETGFAEITSDVTGTFAFAAAANVTASSDTYLEVGFTSAAGSLPPSGGATVQVDIRGPGANGYSNTFDEVNDYSFDLTKTVTYQAWANVTAYLGGQIAWGTEPGAGTSAGNFDGGEDATSLGPDAPASGSEAGSPFDATTPPSDVGADFDGGAAAADTDEAGE